MLGQRPVLVQVVMSHTLGVPAPVAVLSADWEEILAKMTMCYMTIIAIVRQAYTELISEQEVRNITPSNCEELIGKHNDQCGTLGLNFGHLPNQRSTSNFGRASQCNKNITRLITAWYLPESIKGLWGAWPAPLSLTVTCFFFSEGFRNEWWKWTMPHP